MSTEPSLTSMIARLNRRGYLVDGLYQFSDYTWRATLRRRDDLMYHSFGYGRTPQQALRDALASDGSESQRAAKQSRRRLSEVL